MDLKSQKIISDQNFIKEILPLKTKDEIKAKLLAKEVILTDEEFKEYISFILACVNELKNGRDLSEVELESISAGSFQGAIRVVGKTISFPVRAVSYAVGAVVSSLPKGFIDGVYDAWTNWKDYDYDN